MKTNAQFTVTPVAEMIDIVIKGAYVYVSGKDQMAVQVRSVKADTNEILVQELDDKLNLIKDARFTVRLHELYHADEFEMHNNCVVAKLELHKAQATLSRKAKEVEKWKRQANTLNNPERLKAEKALAKAKQAYEIAYDLYAEAKGQEDGRFNVLETVDNFNLTKLDELIAEHEGKANIDDGIDVSRTIKLFDLINMCKIIEVAEQAIKYSPDDEHTLALRQAMYHLRMSSTWRTDHRFVTIWHEVFGGQVQDHQKPGALKQVNAKEVVLKAFDKKTNTISYAGKRVVGIARRWMAAEMAIANEDVAMFEENSLVLVDSRFIKLKHHTGSKEMVTIALRDAGKKIGYTNQILCIRVRKNDEDSCKASVVSDEGMSTLQKLIGLHTTGIQLEGLKNHADFNSVVRCRFTKNDKWANAELLVDPFERMVESTTPEGRAVSVLLAELGYGPCIKADSYEKHGYVQLTSTYLANVGAFGKDGKTCEDIAKLLARYTKQVMNPGYAQFPDMKTVVFGLVDHEVTNLPNDVDTKALEKFNNSLAHGFVAGQSCASKKAFAYMGTGRYVTGSDDEGTGQKTMVCDPYHVMIPELDYVYNNIAGGNDEMFVIAGLNSTKSKKFQLESGWALETFLFEGKKVALWVKTTQETYKLTDSATALQFRAVDEKLTGLAAAENSYARAVEGFTAETVTKLLFTNDGKTLAENAKQLLEEGRIAYKGHTVSTNIQFNQGLEAQFGTDTANRILSALVRNNKASEYRDNLVKSWELMDQQVAEDDVTIVEAQAVVEAIVYGCLERGIPPESVKGKVLHMEIVKKVFELLSAENNSWAKICFPNKATILFPVTQKGLESFEETGRWEYVATQGMMAEFFEAFAFAIQKIAVIADEETGQVTLNGMDKALSPKICDIIASKIAVARDRMAGKELNRIAAYGTTSWLAVSGRLKKNQMHYAVLNVLGSQASKSFREAVVPLYFKSPILWEGSISSCESVDVVGTKEEQEYAKQFAAVDANGEVDVEYHNLMQGKCSYISPEKAVKNGNDADGDMHTILFVPVSAVVGTPLARTWEFIDATDPMVAVGANHHKAHWEKELKGMYLNTTKALNWVSLEGKDSDIAEAVFRAAREKINVGTFTTSQTALLNNRGAFTGHFKEALQACAGSLSKSYKEFDSWINGLLNNPDRLDEVAEAFWSFTVAVQGTCVNLDAMDQVKSSDGRDVVKLADLLRLGNLENCSYRWSMKAGNKLDAVKVLGNINKRVDLIVNTMFNKDLHNMSLGKLVWLFDDLNKYNAKTLQKLVVELVVRCAAHAGYINHYYYDATVIISKTPPKVNGRHEAVDLETLKAGMESLGKEEIEIDCVQRTIFNVAQQYVGKKLV